MYKKYVVVGLCIAALTVGVFAVGRTARTRPAQEVSAPVAPMPSAGVPEHVVYRMFLHQIFHNREVAETNEARGDSRAAYAWRHHYDAAQLSDEQMAALVRIASDCEQEVKAMDARAKVIIDARRALYYPGGKVPPGGKIAPPSPELAAMQEERNAIVLRWRDRVRETFGEQEFARLQEFLRQRVVPHITLTPIAPPSQAAQAESQPEPLR